MMHLLQKATYLKFSALPVPIVASIAFFIMSVIEKGLVFITSPIFTRLLSQAEYGQVAVFNSWISLLGVITMFCLSAGVFNLGLFDYKNERDAYSFSMLALSNIITLLCFVVLLILYPHTASFLGFDLSLLCLMFAIFFTQPAFNFWCARQRFEYKYKMMSAVVISSAILSPIVAIGAIYYFPCNKVYARLIGGYGVMICFYAMTYVYICAKAHWKLKVSYWKEALLFNIPLIPHYLSGYILNHSDRIMISNMVGSTEAAKYSLAYTVALAVTIVWGAINSSLLPYTYEKCQDKNYSALSSVTVVIMSLYAYLCFVLILLAPELVAIMAPPSYKECMYIVPPIVGGIFFLSQYSIFGNIIYYYKKPKFVMFASVTAASLNIFLNWLFIPRYGYLAAGYTTLVCYLLQAIFDYYAMKKVASGYIYKMKPLCALSATIICAAVLGPYIYGSKFIRYALIIVSILGALPFRNNISSVISGMCKKH